MNTLPKAPSSTASRLISAKYSHPMPAETSGPHRPRDIMVNMPPSRPTITTANRMIYPATAPLERALLVLGL